MSDDWTISGDFSTVIDATQPVTLRRRGAGAEDAVPVAFRSSVLVSEAESSAGSVTNSDAVWDFETPALDDNPRIGDSIIDSSGSRWTVIEVRALHGGRVSCLTKNLVIANRLDHRVSIEKAQWSGTGSDAVIVGWTIVRPSIPARIQPAEVAVDRTINPASSVARYRIFFVDDYSLDHDHRLIDSLGRTYAIDRYTQSQRIDAVSVVDATLIYETEP